MLVIQWTPLSGHIPIIAHRLSSPHLQWWTASSSSTEKDGCLTEWFSFLFDFVLCLKSNFQKQWEPIARPQEMRRVALLALKWQVSHIHKVSLCLGEALTEISFLIFSHACVSERTCGLVHWAVANSSTSHLELPLISAGQPAHREQHKHNSTWWKGILAHLPFEAVVLGRDKTDALRHHGQN